MAAVKGDSRLTCGEVTLGQSSNSKRFRCKLPLSITGAAMKANQMKACGISKGSKDKQRAGTRIMARGTIAERISTGGAQSRGSFTLCLDGL